MPLLLAEDNVAMDVPVERATSSVDPVVLIPVPVEDVLELVSWLRLEMVVLMLAVSAVSGVFVEAAEPSLIGEVWTTVRLDEVAELVAWLEDEALLPVALPVVTVLDREDGVTLILEALEVSINGRMPISEVDMLLDGPVVAT